MRAMHARVVSWTMPLNFYLLDENVLLIGGRSGHIWFVSLEDSNVPKMPKRKIETIVLQQKLLYVRHYFIVSSKNDNDDTIKTNLDRTTMITLSLNTISIYLALQEIHKLLP
jgi:hypothetical protein